MPRCQLSLYKFGYNPLPKYNTIPHFYFMLDWRINILSYSLKRVEKSSIGTDYRFAYGISIFKETRILHHRYSLLD
ncbi:MAG: hypothetical protein R3Y08_06745 [Rikenellaceae bacterium]